MKFWYTSQSFQSSGGQAIPGSSGDRRLCQLGQAQYGSPGFSGDHAHIYRGQGHPGIRFNEHMEGDGPTVFTHGCKLGLEGIVSKRKDSVYRFGRSPDWLKMKNSDAPAVRREAEEDWGKRNGDK